MKKNFKFFVFCLALTCAMFGSTVAANATSESIGKGTWDHGHSINAFGHYVYSNFLYPTWHSSTAKMYTEEHTYSKKDSTDKYDWSNAATDTTWKKVTGTDAYYDY
ncbi:MULTISPECIES: hypothetical protein [unclassified Clostridium]|uniref:hypothetical protein n=1 Tax=unclassified Clostridium TaxID=2614128 RepID=UPI0013F0461C|nr:MULTISPECIES: hypothetical protein [unclassified Clostridium]NFR88474.1 hypothetical protein [Clostridium botulinum]NFR91302.1 hypothetical protein [Clostridium botulinum]NFS29953.1 hypothetical protein [Clostridium botulinum]NFS54522.1 hypothetical protein [Clostridium botulinum]NFT18673.1 hypothetical protein [Clostridium botulinum]